MALLERLRSSTQSGVSDAVAASALLELVRDDLAASSAPDGGEMLSESQLSAAIDALADVSARAGRQVLLPFATHGRWLEWAHKQGATNHSTRLALLSTLFDVQWHGAG